MRGGYGGWLEPALLLLMMLGLVGVEDGVSGVRIVGLLREIPTRKVCPPISLERTFSDFI